MDIRGPQSECRTTKSTSQTGKKNYFHDSSSARAATSDRLRGIFTLQLTRQNERSK